MANQEFSKAIQVGDIYEMSFGNRTRLVLSNPNFNKLRYL